jgi:DNA mismatch endonuclease, patch repair protein
MANGSSLGQNKRRFDAVPEARRKLMSAVRHRDTEPERTVRSILHSMGFRFTANGPKNRMLPGKPDIVLPGRKVVVFVNGCFWHGHSACHKYRSPKTRTAFWDAKIRRNIERDRQAIGALQRLSWKVLVIWECQLRTAKRESLMRKLNRTIPDLCRSPSPSLP